MKDLIEALQILQKYLEPGSYAAKHPTNCSHDMLYVDVKPALVSVEDKAKLDALGFIESDDYDGFISWRFGSC